MAGLHKTSGASTYMPLASMHLGVPTKSAWLMRDFLARAILQPAAPGEFLCRAPPQPGYVSTIEAIGRTLLSLNEDGFGAYDADGT